MLKLGVIGAGRLGSFHADKAAKHSGVQFVGISDSCEERRKELAVKHGIADYASSTELLRHVDAVVIAAPTQFHHSLGKEALEAGVHVLMEKPLAVSEWEAQELVQLAGDRKRVLQVGHVEQFNPAWKLAQPVLKAVQSGVRAMITAERTSGYTFRSTDIGVVHDLMVHDLDLILSVVPSPIRLIEATGFHVIGSTMQGGHEDVAHAWIHFENGTVAQIRASRVDSEARRTMRIQTAHLSAEMDFAARETRIIRATDAVVNGEFSPTSLGGTDPTNLAKTFMSEQFPCTKTAGEAVDALVLELDDFVQAIQTERSPQVSGARALHAVATADAIVKRILLETAKGIGHR
ncbi:MAG: Gfo/Idh/MocA family oxidoreductase [Planctomycetaceae bacterium]|nr:Gfo/Idh/MocA family oxidoreductase [Planctomycetaceae bacterium]